MLAQIMSLFANPRSKYLNYLAQVKANVKFGQFLLMTANIIRRECRSATWPIRRILSAAFSPPQRDLRRIQGTLSGCSCPGLVRPC